METLRKLPKLQTIFLDYLPITDAGLARLDGLKDLTYLRARRSKITADGAKKFFAAHPKAAILLSEFE
jgi:hypothetical protein